ncbi:MAG: adenylosuccinate lyase [Planctomycetota bacterium]|jgi:adenylosuccinate lyase
MPDATPAHLPPADAHDPHAGYRSPLETRNASREMRACWSERRKFGCWRRIWLALAESQHEIGLPVSAAQVEAIRAHLDDIDFEAAAHHERRLRHDVMAHVHTLGDAAPEARAIIHFGATSQDVVCNADILILRDALAIVAGKLARAIDRLATFAARERATPTLGFTHFQPAQPTTVGKRATLWAQDLAIALEQVEFAASSLRLRGLRGATGTQASYLGLLGGDGAKVDELERRFAAKLGWPADRLLAVCGQTYPRLVDAQIVGALAVAASAVHKCATDLRLLANRKEVEEPFEKEQIGSSAMAYKRNPMRSERACGLARFVMGLVNDPLQTHATQWLERTLDDSSNRRLVLPEAFLALDGALDILANVAEGLVVWEATVAANLAAELPFMASENIMLAATKAGADRQEAHEVIRVHSMAAAEEVKRFGRPNDLMARLKADPFFAKVDLEGALDPSSFVGRAPEQTDRFIETVVEPIRARHRDALRTTADLRV